MMTKMKLLLLPLLFLAAAMANAQGSVVDTKAEARKAADKYVEQCKDNVKKSRRMLKQRQRAEREALDKAVNSPEYKDLLEMQQRVRKFAEGIYKRDKKTVRKYAREAKRDGDIIDTRRTANVCYYVPPNF